MAPYYNTESIERAVIQLLCDPSIILPEPLNTTLPVVSLWPIYLDNNFEVKLREEGCVFVDFFQY